MTKILASNSLRVVDVGASGGIDPRWGALTEGYIAVLVEPDFKAYQKLIKNKKKNVIVLNTALSDARREIGFHLCRKQEVSSVLSPNFELLKQFQGSDRFEVVEKIQLQADTLNSQLELNDIDEVDFIKLDTQGHELHILKGGEQYLDRVVGVEVEVEFVPVYINQPLFCDVNAYLTDQGFDLFDLKRHYWKQSNGQGPSSQKGQLIFGDALYLRDPEQVLAIAGISREKVARAALVYLAYGYPDLARALVDRALEENIVDQACYDDVKCIIIQRIPRKIPYFKGRHKIHRLIHRLAAMLSVSGSDKDLGNP